MSLRLIKGGKSDDDDWVTMPLRESETWMLDHPATTPVDPAVHNLLIQDLIVRLGVLRAITGAKEEEER